MFEPTDLNGLRDRWHQETGNLLPGEQAVFRDILGLVAEEKKHNLVWGTDYSNDAKNACLVNAAGSMLSKGDGSGTPMAQFGPVVSLYDDINREFKKQGINTDEHVSPLAAEILLQWFAEPVTLEAKPSDADFEADADFDFDQPYVERSDEEMAEALNSMLSAPAPAVDTPTVTPFDDVDEVFAQLPLDEQIRNTGANK